MAWVFIEETEGAPAPIGLEMLAKARTFGYTSVIYFGAGSETAFAELGNHGASTVYHLTPAAGSLGTAEVAVAVADLIAKHSPDVIMFGMTYNDRDIAGRLSAKLDRPIVSNAIDLDISDGTVTAMSEIFGGTTLVETQFEAEPPHLIIIRPKSFVAEPVGGATPTVVVVSLGDAGQSGNATVTGSFAESSEGPKLSEAAVIISGGRGLGTAEHYELIEKVAAPLQAATGATRAIVDAGWVPYAKQVGQTGKTVKPDVYIACGVSGAMQHLVGMKDSKVIIAINKDEQAPIFGVADLGVVGDVHQVLPKLIAALESR